MSPAGFIVRGLIDPVVCQNSAEGVLNFHTNVALCQGLLDALVAGLTIDGAIYSYGNDDSC
jgi:hypothetical protein